MKILICPDSFKESLSSIEAANIMEYVCRKIFPSSYIINFPIADGGEGTIDVIKKIIGGRLIKEEVLDPVGRKIKAEWLMNKDTGYVEMAKASGLILLKEKEKNPMETTSFGTGQLIKKAIDRGCKEIYICVGGSATNDGGIGALTALGAKIYGQNNRLISPGKGKDLICIKKIDIFLLYLHNFSCRFIIFSDVKNVLYGREGASYVYGRQKGADDKTIKFLDNGMKNYADIIKKTINKDISKILGTGAAGGFSVPFISFFDAKIVSGIETILKIGGFEEKIKDTDLILTGEGRIDSQVRYGKALDVVFKISQKYKKNTIAFAGSIEKGVYEFIKSPYIIIVSILPGITILEDALKNAKIYLQTKVEQMLKTVGFGLSNNHRRKNVKD
ncbi:MAG: glycerate kinase [Actinobacteria bacterium]|nr:glycerate kinase [Actinomycetota bacterium]